MVTRSSEELSNVPNPAWPAVRDLIQQHPDSTNLDVDPEQGREVLRHLQVTVGSPLGVLALNSGGVLADHGWFRILGGGSERMPDLASANGLASPDEVTGPPPYLMVGYDVLGGRFAIDGGGLGVSPGEVCYFGPDSLTWDGLGGGHGDFVAAAIGGHLAPAFAALRWPGWEDEVAAVPPHQGLSVYPPPFSREGKDIAAASRRVVPVQELFSFYDGAARQIGTGRPD